MHRPFILALFLAAGHSGAAAMTADCINLINKDDAGFVLFRFTEEVPDPGSSYPHKHLDKIRAADAVERDISLASNGAGQ